MKPSWTLGLICARGGSKGVPRKNIRLLAGKPLIAWSIKAAKACPEIDMVIVSTDDPEIAEVARAHGAEVPFMRPPELATDSASEWLVWRHALQAMEKLTGVPPGILLNIPPTAPLRNAGDLSSCYRTLYESDADVVITVRPAERNPYFNMVKLDEAGYAHVLMSTGATHHQRQKAPSVFDVTTVAYAARAPFVLAKDSLFEGQVRTVTVPQERALDIDTEFDFRVAECLLQWSHQQERVES